MPRARRSHVDNQEEELVKKYECLFIIEPDAASERFDQVKTSITQDIERYNGTVDAVEEVGQRVLSYPIRHCTEGFYYQVRFALAPETIGELRSRYRLNTDILRFLISKTE
jgi:ribosomal protein S6